MGFSTMISVGTITPPLAGGTKASLNRPQPELVTVLKAPLAQVKNERVLREQQPQCITAVTGTRRDALLTTVSLAATSLFPAGSADARVVDPEIRRKIFEKLKLLREKFGLSKPEDKTSSTIPEKAPKQPSPKEKTAQAAKQETPHLLIPQNIRKLPTVEATLP